MNRLTLFLMLFCGMPGAIAAFGQASDPPGDPNRDIRFEQHLNQSVNPEIEFIDEQGRAVVLGKYFNQRPVVIAMGYYRCPMLCGVVLNAFVQNVHVHDTYFVIAHFHYIMVGGMVMAFMGGLHFWWPKITGRMYPELLGKMTAIVTFLGFNLTFFPQFILGYLGMPRRYHAYPEQFQVYNVLSTAGASILGLGYLLPLCYLIWSCRYGKRAGDNPWGAKGFEWETASPPPSENFEKPPVQTEEAYAYPVPSSEPITE